MKSNVKARWSMRRQKPLPSEDEIQDEIWEDESPAPAPEESDEDADD